nr:trypsin-like peptidase domain-containing protein [Paraburkholderia tagetis]
MLCARLAACLIPALSVGCVSPSAQPSVAPDVVLASALPAVQHGPPPGIVTDFADLVRQNGPAVINISAAHRTHVANLTALWPPAPREDEPFVQFFRQFSPGESSDAQSQGSAGSGFIISPDGYILTDARVVEGATHVRVSLTDGREFTASIVGIDSPSDVALLKIGARGLPTVKIGTPSAAKVGQWGVSIGSPYGLDNTVTAGIISSKGRLLPAETYIPLIQTDLTLNAGDSGGPLFDLGGTVIGRDAPARPALQGLSSAIPIDEAMRIGQQLRLHGKVEHGRLGVTVQEVSVPLAQSFGLQKPVGALVSSVDVSGPAARSGLRSGDVILRLDDVPITDSKQLPMVVADRRPGTAAHVEFWRNRGTHDAVVMLGAMSGDLLAAERPVRVASGKFGLIVRSLTSEEQRKAGLPGGVLFERSTGPAALAGILPGDVISRVNNRPVLNAAQLREQLDRARNRVALLVQRDGQPMFDVARDFRIR